MLRAKANEKKKFKEVWVKIYANEAWQIELQKNIFTFFSDGKSFQVCTDVTAILIRQITL